MKNFTIAHSKISQFSKLCIAVLLIFSSTAISCNNDDGDTNTEDPNGFLEDGEKVFVKMRIDGVLWESVKTEGSAAYIPSVSNTVTINAEGSPNGYIQIVIANAASTGTFTLPATSSQFTFGNGTILLAINSNFPGTSLTLNVADAIEYQAGANYSIKGTFSGVAFETVSDTFVNITEGEFYGGAIE